jgi:HlyD family secretion protein
VNVRLYAVVLSFALLCALSTPPAAAPLLVGEVRATGAEPIHTPPSNNSPVVLRYLLPEGSQVSPGDVLVRIDPGGSATQVQQLAAQIEQTRARAAKEIAELEVRAADAERSALDADLALAKARIDAGIPRSHLSALEADRFTGELERAEREFALKSREQVAAVEAVERRRADAGLETAKLEADLVYHQAQVENSEYRAGRAGIVVYGFDRWRGQRYEEGSNAHAGHKIGEVVGDGAMAVVAWALEPDRNRLRRGQSVRLAFDALPGAAVGGRIERISGAPEPKAEWGDGRYFTVDVVLDEHTLPLRPGMSARVEPLAGDET